jgi:hypothetical protein
MYTPLEKAKDEVWKRWNDEALKKRVEDYLGGAIPEVFLRAPRAAIFRNIISPNLEYLRFRELAYEIGLEPLGLEYHADQFCTRSTDKLMLAKLRIFQGRDRNGAAITRCEKIIDVKASDNKAFRHIHTVWGENLVDFHRSMAMAHVGTHEVHDLSGWLHDHSTIALENYRRLFALFTCFGVLLENFATNTAESAFAVEVVYPAFDDVRGILGVAPLVAPIYSEAELEDISCWCYPGSALEMITERRTTGTVKRRLIELFSRHCSGCFGACCSKEEVTVFASELEKLPISPEQLTFIQPCTHSKSPTNGAVERISIAESCPFLEDGKGCVLDIGVKPLDCLTYPIYPLVNYRSDEDKELVGMMVHKSCSCADRISADCQLMGAMREFWERELKKIPGADLRQWFGDSLEYWQEHNLIVR